jgi:hypothetical protein
MAVGEALRVTLAHYLMRDNSMRIRAISRKLPPTDLLNVFIARRGINFVRKIYSTGFVRRSRTYSKFYRYEFLKCYTPLMHRGPYGESFFLEFRSVTWNESQFGPGFDCLVAAFDGDDPNTLYRFIP